MFSNSNGVEFFMDENNSGRKSYTLNLIMGKFRLKINWHCMCWNSFPNKTDRVRILHCPIVKLNKYLGKNYSEGMNLEWKKLNLWNDVMDC